MSNCERITVVKLKSPINGVPVSHCRSSLNIYAQPNILLWTLNYVCITAIHNMTYENSVISKSY